MLLLQNFFKTIWSTISNWGIKFVMEYDFALFIAPISCKLFALKYEIKNDHHNTHACIIALYLRFKSSYIVTMYCQFFWNNILQNGNGSLKCLFDNIQRPENVFKSPTWAYNTSKYLTLWKYKFLKVHT